MMIPYLGVWLCLALMHSKLIRTIKWLETSGHVTPGHVGPRCDAIFKKMHVGHPGMVSGATYICVCIYTYTDIQIYIYIVYIYTSVHRYPYTTLDIPHISWEQHLCLPTYIGVSHESSRPFPLGLPGKAEQLDGAGLPRLRIQPIKVGLSPR